MGLILLILQGSFIYNVQKDGRGVTKLLEFWLMVLHSFGAEKRFDPVDIHTYEQKISFFQHISNFLTIFWLLLHCFHPETSIVVNL